MPDLRERFLYPRAGWLSLGLLVIMALAVAWSVQAARLIEQMEFLAPLAVWAVLLGALLGMLRLSIVITLPLGAVAGAALVLWSVGGEYFTELEQGGRLLALRTDLLDWFVIVVRIGYPPQMAPYAIGLGVLMFATAFAAAYAVYRHHRVLDAILLLGAAVIINMSAIDADNFGQLLLFVVAALLLWLRASLVDRQDGWQRRRVNENLEVPAAIMRSGVLFAGASVALAWILTTVAVAAPLTEAWRSLDGAWTGVRDQFEGVFGSLTNPQSRISGDTFGSSFVIQSEWVSVDDEAMVVAAPRPLYLRTVTHDVYTGRGWDTTRPLGHRAVAAGDDALRRADHRASASSPRRSRSPSSRSRCARRSAATSSPPARRFTFTRRASWSSRTASRCSAESSTPTRWAPASRMSWRSPSRRPPRRS